MTIEGDPKFKSQLLPPLVVMHMLALVKKIYNQPTLLVC